MRLEADDLAVVVGRGFDRRLADLVRGDRLRVWCELGDHVNARATALELHGKREARVAAAHHQVILRSVLYHLTSKHMHFVPVPSPRVPTGT